jgi:NDP-sugar pyrophosphorylase family protein
MSRRAVVLAGGQGTRLRPYTIVLPKPLMPIGEYPILEVIVRQLARFGFDRITMAVNHQANIIKAFFGDGEQWGIRIDYSLESIPLSTVAPLCLIADLPDDFLLMNGDILTDLDFDWLYGRHVSGGCLFTVAAARRVHTIDYGVLEIDGSHVLTGFTEKPSAEYLVSMGVYVVNKAVLSMVPGAQAYGFDNLMRDLLAAKKRVDVYPYDGYWLDIGRPDDYMRAVDEFGRQKAKLLWNE